MLSITLAALFYKDKPIFALHCVSLSESQYVAKNRSITNSLGFYRIEEATICLK